MLARLIVLLIFVSNVLSVRIPPDHSLEDYEKADVKCLKFSPGDLTLEKYYHDMLKTKPVNLPTVEWWFIIKESNGWGFYYYDSDMDANNEKALIFYPWANPYNLLNMFMLNHYRVLNGKNIRSTYNGATKTIINLGREQNSNMDFSSVQLKSLGMWFNDQESEGVPFKGYPATKLKDSKLEAKNYKWKFAHSKFVLALEVKEKKFTGGYMIDHSIPQSPHGQNFRQTEWIDEGSYPGMNEYSHLEGDGWEFFGDNGKAKAQHLSCFNFTESEVESLLKNLSRTLPKPVLSTLSSKLFKPTTLNPLNPKLETLLDTNHAKWVQDFFTPENTLKSAHDCLDAWTRRRMFFSPWKLLTLITPECTQSMDIQSGLIKLISHSPTPHVATLPGDIDDGKSPETPVAQQESSNSMEVDAGSMSTTREVYATFFGPIPWKVTANILKTHLYISTWTNVDLPTIIQNNIGVYLGDGLKMKGNLYGKGEPENAWTRGQSHEKIGIALRKSDDNKYWTCSADGNHRTSEISHAGATICISSENLWTAVTSRLRSEGGSYSDIKRVGQEEKRDAHLDITLSAKETKYTPVFSWHISNKDPSPEQKTSGVLGLSYASSSSSGGATRSNAMDVDDPTKREPPKPKPKPRPGKRHSNDINPSDMPKPKRSKGR